MSTALVIHLESSRTISNEMDEDNHVVVVVVVFVFCCCLEGGGSSSGHLVTCDRFATCAILGKIALLSCPLVGKSYLLLLVQFCQP